MLVKNLFRLGTMAVALVGAQAGFAHEAEGREKPSFVAVPTVAQSTLRTGAHAISGTGVQAKAISGTGVYGQAISGTGVQAKAISGTGVYGQAISGTGVQAKAISGTGAP